MKTIYHYPPKPVVIVPVPVVPVDPWDRFVELLIENELRIRSEERTKMWKAYSERLSAK